ncbi:hypothetical protein HQO42_10825 [Rhodococcus fascians]|nr:hypothetical protein [Rhodococcus fascians]MBY4237467.1 hypothetical protein [Rhodococcus fascians]MBY4253146.1 hypothetical protein [Rhodococcus fascians]MBY4268614.1 hypothetical protein [Rhodococcus fascians]
MRGGVEGDLGRAAAQVSSAAVSSQLSLDAYAAGRTTVAATDTALGDMLEEVDRAAAAAADRAVDTTAQAALRSEVTRSAGEVSDYIVRGRDIVAGLGAQTEAGRVAAHLGDTGMRAQVLSERLGVG